MEIHYGGNDKHLIFDCVNQGIRELFDKAAVKRVVERSPAIREFHDTLNRGPHLFREGDSKASLLEFVVFNRVEEFFPSRLSKLAPHFRNLALIS